ncbi:11572_t:CDS:2, partial [Gigaspora margarita]
DLEGHRGSWFLITIRGKYTIIERTYSSKILVKLELEASRGADICQVKGSYSLASYKIWVATQLRLCRMLFHVLMSAPLEASDYEH